MPLQSLIDVLSNFESSLTNTDKDWVIFVRDHKQYLINKANKIPITPEMIDRYKYKFNFFMLENKINLDMHWIIMMINDFNDLEDFSNKENVYLPDRSDIIALYQLYKTANKLKR